MERNADCERRLALVTAAAMFNDLSSPAALIATRRSGKPRDMAAPGPTAEQFDRILAAATRVPDHGKLAPWRFVIVPDDRRDAFAALLETAYRAERPDPGKVELEAVRQFAHQAPALVVVLSAPAHASHIPIWGAGIVGRCRVHEPAGRYPCRRAGGGLADRLGRLFDDRARGIRRGGRADCGLHLHRHTHPRTGRAPASRSRESDFSLERVK
jgi:hypothetical protein